MINTLKNEKQKGKKIKSLRFQDILEPMTMNYRKTTTIAL